MSRRTLLATLLLLPLAGCAPPRPATDAKAPGKPAVAPTKAPLTIYSPNGDEMLKPYKERWAAAHPEIALQTVDMGAQEVLDRLRAEKANPVADIWWGAPHTNFVQAAELGLLEPYEPTWSKTMDPARRDPQHRWYGQWLTPGVIVYNTDAVQPADAPKDWDDLLDARWKGKIIIRDPLKSGTMRSFIAAMIQRQPSVDAGFAWLTRLDANTTTYTADPAMLFRQFQAQEGVVTVWNLRDVFIQRRDHGYKLGFVIPKSGCPMVLDGLALVKGSRQPEAARTFYEWVTSTEQMAYAAEKFYCLPARDAGRDKLPADLPRDLPELKLDWAKVRTDGDQWMQRWDQTVKGKGAKG
ncbi:MAG: extracellular solute-binding protein [Armatimonadetes bacterium]|nr:extracellular solute-binding protein [Armatimonadota bacterium]